MYVTVLQVSHRVRRKRQHKSPPLVGSQIRSFVLRRKVAEEENTQKLQAQHTIVSPHERIAVRPPHLAVHKLTRALEGNVHVAVDGLQFACVESRSASSFTWKGTIGPRSPGDVNGRHTLVHNTRVELDGHRGADDIAQEARGVVGCWSGGGRGAVGCCGGHFTCDFQRLICFLIFLS